MVYTGAGPIDIDISGDKNAGGLLEIIGPTKPTHAIYTVKLKSEFGHNPFRDPAKEAAPVTKNALVLNNLQTANIDASITHHSDAEAALSYSPTANTAIGASLVNLTGAKVKRFTNGNIVVFTALTAGVTGLVVNKQYFVVGETANGFEVSATEGGSAILVAGHELEAGSTTVAQLNPMGAAILITRHTITDAAIEAGKKVLTCAISTPFESGMVGQTVIIQGAGAAGAALTTTITKYTSASVVELTVAASTTVAAATAQVPVLNPNVYANVVVTLTTVGEAAAEVGRAIEDENTGVKYSANGSNNGGVLSGHVEYSSGTSTYSAASGGASRHHVWGQTGGFQGSGGYGETVGYQIAGVANPVFSIYNSGAPEGKKNFAIRIDNEGNINFVGLTSGNALEANAFMKITRNAPGSSTVVPGLVDKVRSVENEAINLAVEDKLIVYKTLASSHVVNLPKLSEVPEGKTYILVDASGNAAAGVKLTLTPNGADAIHGLTTVEAAYAVRTVRAVAGIWVGS